MPAKLFKEASHFNGHMEKYVFKKDVKGLGYYYDTATHELSHEIRYFGRGLTHNKCREPFARALKLYDEECQDMTLGEIAHWATKHRMIRQAFIKPSVNTKPMPITNIMESIANLSTNGIEIPNLENLVAHVSTITKRKAPETHQDMAAFLTAYYNWERFNLTPILPPICIKYMSLPELDAAECLSLLTSTSS